MKVLVYAKYWEYMQHFTEFGSGGKDYIEECNVEYESAMKINFTEAKDEVRKQMNLPASARVVIMNIMTDKE